MSGKVVLGFVVGAIIGGAIIGIVVPIVIYNGVLGSGGDGIVVCLPYTVIIGGIIGATIGLGWGLDKMDNDESTEPPDAETKPPG